MDKQTIIVAGLAVNVFHLQDQAADAVPATDHKVDHGPGPKKPVAILFLLHGRTSRADHMELVAKALLDEVHVRRKDGHKANEEKHDLWIVTFVSAHRCALVK